MTCLTPRRAQTSLRRAQMSTSSNRRTFLAATGAGAAAVGGTVALAGSGSAGAAPKSAKAAQSVVVAHIKDHTSSKLSLFVGDREVVVHDRDLVQRILNAAG